MKMKIKWEKFFHDPDELEITRNKKHGEKSTAEVTIHGLREYGGTKIVTFKINAQPMSGR